MVEILYGDDRPEQFRGELYGVAMMGRVRPWKGTAFNAGTCEWVNGLIRRDEFIETITHTVLRRFGEEESSGIVLTAE